MNRIKAILFSLLLCPTVSFSATLDVSKSVEIMALNGKKTSEIDTLPVGKNQVILAYSESLKDGSKSNRFTSSPLVLTVSVDKDEDTLVLSHRIFKTYDKAKSAFARNSVGWKLATNGKEEPVDLVKLPGRPGFMPYSDLEGVIGDYNRSQGIILTSTGTQSITEAAVAVSETGEIQITGDATTQLKLWYSKASKAERKEFRKWMIDQE